MSTKPTPAQMRFIREHLNAAPEAWVRRGKYEDGFRPRWLSDRGSPTYTFVGRCRDAGFIEIDDGEHAHGWPFQWRGTRLTAAGWETVGLTAPTDAVGAAMATLTDEQKQNLLG